MSKIKFFSGESLPLEMHKIKIVQKINLLSIDERKKSIDAAGNNTFLLRTKDVFLDMLTDSGTNAMSDRQLAASMMADDSYAGSETFFKLEKKLNEFFGTKFFLPAHQGRACENIISEAFVTEGSVVPMNYHFTTTKSHITRKGGIVEELIIDEALKTTSDYPFKGNMDIDKLKKSLNSNKGKVAFVRMEAGTNLIGGQPFSLQNLRDVSNVCKDYGVFLVLDASLLADNLYFIKKREQAYKNKSLNEITKEIGSLCDITYFSARKLGCAKGGGICSSDEKLVEQMKELVPLFEGFLTYGGMSAREMESIVVGLDETLDMDMVSQGPIFIEAMVKELQKRNVPVVTPAGGLGCHLNVTEILPHIAQSEYPSGAMAAALYIASGVRGMERGTMSEQRNDDGSEHFSNMELLRLAVPRRSMTYSQIMYAVDRVDWLYQNRDIIGGLRFTEEPRILRFFFGKLEPVSNWQEKLVKKYKEDFGDSL